MGFGALERGSGSSTYLRGEISNQEYVPRGAGKERFDFLREAGSVRALGRPLEVAFRLPRTRIGRTGWPRALNDWENSRSTQNLLNRRLPEVGMDRETRLPSGLMLMVKLPRLGSGFVRSASSRGQGAP